MLRLRVDIADFDLGQFLGAALARGLGENGLTHVDTGGLIVALVVVAW